MARRSGLSESGLHQTIHDLSARSRRLQAILETAADGIHILDEQGRVTEFSDSFAHMLGYSKEETAELRVSDFDAELPIDELMTRIARATASPKVFETKHKRKDGTILDVEISAKSIEADGTRFVYASSRDISARKQLEQKLAATTLELEDLYENAPCGYHSVGPDGTYQRVNAKELEWLGCTKAEVVGKMAPRDFFTPDSQARFDRFFSPALPVDLYNRPDLESAPRRDAAGGVYEQVCGSAGIYAESRCEH